MGWGLYTSDITMPNMTRRQKIRLLLLSYQRFLERLDGATLDDIIEDDETLKEDELKSMN